MATLTLKKKEKKPTEYAKARRWVKSQLPEPPYAIGIQEQLLEIIPDDISKKLVIQNLKYITRSIKYLQSFELAEYRTDLNETKTPIKEAHRFFSNGLLLGKKICAEKIKKLDKK